MKKFAALCALAVVLGCLFLAGGAFAEEKSYVWKVAHIRPAGSEIDKEITWFADEMRKATDGRIDIQVYGANQLVTLVAIDADFDVAVERAPRPPAGTIGASGGFACHEVRGRSRRRKTVWRSL